jgi:hypothetical protein
MLDSYFSVRIYLFISKHLKQLKSTGFRNNQIFFINLFIIYLYYLCSRTGRLQANYPSEPTRKLKIVNCAREKIKI